MTRSPTRSVISLMLLYFAPFNSNLSARECSVFTRCSMAVTYMSCLSRAWRNCSLASWASNFSVGSSSRYCCINDSPCVSSLSVLSILPAILFELEEVDEARHGKDCTNAVGNAPDINVVALGLGTLQNAKEDT